jgi:hypothetical protein
MSRNKTPRIFLNTPFEELAHLTLFINFCPRSAIAKSTTHNQKTYAKRFIIPIKKLAGRITARITPYVGLQLAKTGPRDIPTNMLPSIHFLLLLFIRISFDFEEKPNLVEIFFHRFGKIVIIPKSIKITPENTFQTSGLTPIKRVEALSNREKPIIEIPKEVIMIYGFNLFCKSSTDAQSITGRSGNTQGANIVSTPAKIEIITKLIYFLYKLLLQSIRKYLK